MSLEQADAEAAAVAVAPRVSLADIEDKIAWKVFTNGVDLLETTEGVAKSITGPLSLLTQCTVITRSGFTVVGTSACASPENFDAELGEKLAFEDCVRQLWRLEGYLLRENLGPYWPAEDDDNGSLG